MSYVYKITDSELYTVGFYEPNGKWQAESDHNTREKASARVAFLNGSSNLTELHNLRARVERLEDQVDRFVWSKFNEKRNNEYKQ